MFLLFRKRSICSFVMLSIKIIWIRSRPGQSVLWRKVKAVMVTLSSVWHSQCKKPSDFRLKWREIIISNLRLLGRRAPTNAKFPLVLFAWVRLWNQCLFTLLTQVDCSNQPYTYSKFVLMSQYSQHNTLQSPDFNTTNIFNLCKNAN